MIAPSWRRPQMSEWEHVGIRPVSGFAFARPCGSVLELVAKSFGIWAVIVPDVPNVVGDPPHLRVLPHLVELLHRRRARRKAKHDGSASLVQRLPDHANVVALIRMAADAIHFDQVNSPSRVQAGDGVVIGL